MLSNQSLLYGHIRNSDSLNSLHRSKQGVDSRFRGNDGMGAGITGSGRERRDGGGNDGMRREWRERRDGGRE